MTPDRYRGCLLGLALGDAFGAPFEGGPLERLLWSCMGKTRQGQRRWTDDTQMALDLGESLLQHQGLNPDAVAQQFAASYRWHRGYGPGMARMLKRVARGEPWQQANRAVYPAGSFGNGAAMRVPVMALFYAAHKPQLLDAVRASAGITHAHPLGIAGAVLVASATHQLLQGEPSWQVLETAVADCDAEVFHQRLTVVQAWLQNALQPDPQTLARALGNGITAPASCLTALYLALRFSEAPFVELLSFIRAVKGDVDTIGAMAGALWGAARGASQLPADLLRQLEQQPRIQALADQLYNHRGQKTDDLSG